MIRFIFTVVVFLFGMLSISFGQKQEIEKRVKPDVVPANAVNWIKKVKIKKKRLRWYFEATSGKKSYEAKFLHDKRLYSVEFDTLGNIEDVEIFLKKRELDSKTTELIESTIDDRFLKFKIVKIQVQYVDAGDVLLRWMNGGQVNVNKQYEVEFEAKEDSVWRMYEGTFTAKGTLVNSREIIMRSTENLNY